MIKLRIAIKDEDKFELILRLFQEQIHKELYKIDKLDIQSEDDYLYYILEYKHPKFLNRILIKLKDLIEIIGLNVEYGFVYTKEEAYTDIDTQSRRYIIYNNLKY